MMTRTLTRNWNVAAGLVAAGMLAASAHAGTITATPLTDNETDIVNTGGGVVSAANFGSEAGGNVSVDLNGILHEVASSANNTDGAGLIANATINSTFNGYYRNARADSAGYTGDLNNLMSGIAGIASPGPVTIEISDLTPGTTYLFQGYWEAYQENQVVSVTFEDTDTLGGITATYNEETDYGLGTLISYEFTAGDDTLTAALTKTSGSGDVWWYGYSVQAVPEPGSLTLLGLGSLMILRRRSRTGA